MRSRFPLLAIVIAIMAVVPVAIAGGGTCSRGATVCTGTSGSDRLTTGNGDDVIRGEAGNDLMIDGTLDEPSRDNVSAGAGKDVILVDNKPATKDILSCGPSLDRALADRKDVVAADCEKVVVVHGSLEDVIRQEDRFFRSIPQSFFQGLPG